MKKVIRTVTAFILAMTSFFPGICRGQSHQGNISAAEQMVQSSHDLVRANARQVMNTYLVSEMHSLLEARGLVQTAKQVRQYIGNKASESDILLKQTARTASLDLDFIRQLNDDSLENLYLSFREKTNQLNLLNYELETALLGLMETKGVYYRLAEDLEARIETLCSRGIAIDPMAKVLPVILATAKSYDIYFQQTFDERLDVDISASDGMTISEVQDTDEKRAAWVLAYATTYIVALKLISGSWVLAGSAGSAGSAGTALTATSTVTGSQMALAAASATAIMAIIAVGILAISHVNSVAESSSVVRDAVSAFDRQATAEDGRRYIMGYCQDAQSVLKDIPSRLLKIEAEDAAELENLSKIVPGRLEILEKFLESELTLDKKYRELREKYTSEGKVNKALLDENLKKTDEFINFYKMSESMTPKVFGELVEVVLLTGFRDIVQEIQRNKSIIVPGSDEIKQVEQHENFLWTLVRERKTMKAEMVIHKNWQREIDENREVARLYAELDWIVLYHANLVVHDFWSHSESDSWKTLEQNKKDWKGHLDRLLNEYPRSGLLLRLQSSYQNLSGKK